ncbi:uncharacterized protein ColSpa_08924 [Colletotrichum spaethianum]|uniref:Uncharacterized protein n=1 Tax=Colletotrichum spaethianum TaxID=700344 RepID=A0AA37PAM0_9PEZI|nr:uncharacterized protein ColSpa_08924 [Colletotrichum spaethianum]GKT48743.1 hypothetical protein ColSpa_08924 [Colletotrichum spaethianum]
MSMCIAVVQSIAGTLNGWGEVARWELREPGSRTLTSIGGFGIPTHGQTAGGSPRAFSAACAH